MVVRVSDQGPGGPDGDGAPEAVPSATAGGRTDAQTRLDAAAAGERAEGEKAATEIAAGDVADKLADFA